MKNYKYPVMWLMLASCLWAGPVLGSSPDIPHERTEPELAQIERPIYHLDLDIRNGIAFRMQLNNFGFALGGEYQRVLSRYTTGIFEIQIHPVKDQSEQTFQSYFGYSVIPNKYNRVMAFPALMGINRRLFADYVSDDFRFFAQLSAGPSPAYVYPYFNDLGTGFRILDMPGQENFDPFQGWGDGSFRLGAAGQISLGADLGGDFGNIQSVRIGFYFNYYPGGIQIMEPNRRDYQLFDVFDFFNTRDISRQPEGAILPAASKQSFFGTPHITVVLGTMW